MNFTLYFGRFFGIRDGMMQEKIFINVNFLLFSASSAEFQEKRVFFRWSLEQAVCRDWKKETENRENSGFPR